MDDNPQQVTLKDVYDLVDNSRKETADQIEKVNGNVTELKVDVGKLETKLDGHDSRIEQNETDIRTLRERLNSELRRAAAAGGITGVLANIVLEVIKFVSARLALGP